MRLTLHGIKHKSHHSKVHFKKNINKPQMHTSVESFWHFSSPVSSYCWSPKTFDSHISMSVKFYLTECQNKYRPRRAQKQDSFMFGDPLYSTLFSIRHSKWNKLTQQFTINIQRSIAKIQEKSFQHVHDLGVSCKADWKEIPLWMTSFLFCSFLLSSLATISLSIVNSIVFL